MLKIDDNLLQELGLGTLPIEEKRSLLTHIYETLEMRVGMRLADQMSNEQLDEFERYFEAKDDAGAFKWLETNFPNYKDIVNEEFEKLRAEVGQNAPQILAAGQQATPAGAAPQANPAAAQQPYAGSQPTSPAASAQPTAPAPPQPAPGYQPSVAPAPAQPYAAPPQPAYQQPQPAQPPLQPYQGQVPQQVQPQPPAQPWQPQPLQPPPDNSQPPFPPQPGQAA